MQELPGLMLILVLHFQPTLYDIEFRNEDNGMAVGSTGRIYYTNDGGATWTFENTGMSTIYAVAIETNSPDTSAAYVSGCQPLCAKQPML